MTSWGGGGKRRPWIFSDILAKDAHEVTTFPAGAPRTAAPTTGPTGSAGAPRRAPSSYLQSRTMAAYLGPPHKHHGHFGVGGQLGERGVQARAVLCGTKAER